MKIYRNWIVISLLFALNVFLSGLLQAQSGQGTELNIGLDIVQFKTDDENIQVDFIYEIPYEQLAFKPDVKYPNMFSVVQINTNFSIRDMASGKFIREDIWDTPIGFLKNNLEIEKPPFPLLFTEKIPAGEYELFLKVTDLNANRSATIQRPFRVKNFPVDQLALSEIIFAKDIQPDTLQTMFSKNGYSIKVNPTNHFNILHPLLYYYFEVYNLSYTENQPAQNFLAEYALISSAGDTVKAFKAREIEKPGKSCVLVDAKNIVTLKDGDYDLMVRITDPATGQAAEKIKRFHMTKTIEIFEKENEINPMTAGDADAFLDKVQYFISGKERKEFEHLDPQGKARFAVKFWRERDPVPMTPENEFKIMIEKRINHANTSFAPTRTIKSIKPGYKTDRGRIYIKYGDPDDQYEESMPYGDEPLLIWRYFNRTDVSYFVFVDEKSLGDFKLIYSDDETEVVDPTLAKKYGENWKYIMESIYR